LRDLAKETGFSVATISMALRGGMGKLPAATVAAVQDAAARLGYQANSPAALLASQRDPKRNLRTAVAVAALGVGNPPGLLYTGFAEACEKLGLAVERVSVGHSRAEAAGLLNELWHRGVSGIFLHTRGIGFDEEELAAADWSRFAVVKSSRDMPSLRFHLVRLSAFDYMLETLRGVAEAGHRRIAVVLSTSGADRDDMARQGAALAFGRQLEARGGRLLLHVCNTSHTGGPAKVASVTSWLRRIRATAAVVFPGNWYHPIIAAGIRVPDDLSLASPLAYQWLEKAVGFAGCDPQNKQIGVRAAERLYRLIRSNERGMTSEPVEDVIEPVWLNGGTLSKYF